MRVGLFGMITSLRSIACLAALGCGAAPSSSSTVAPVTTTHVVVTPLGNDVYAAVRTEPLGLAVNSNSVFIVNDDHVVVVDAQFTRAATLETLAALRRITRKPVRFVINSHPHFDHASGLQAAVAEGATILTHRNNEPVLERFLSGPRTLTGDSLAKVTNRRNDVVQGIGDRDVRRGTNNKVVELHHVPNEHSDGMLVVHLPAEKVLWSADVTVVNPNPTQLATLRAVHTATSRFDYTAFIPAHPPNPDRPLTKADVTSAVGN